MKNPFLSKNFWANILNILVVFLIGAGIAVPSDTGSDLMDAILKFNPFLIGSLLISNIMLPLYKTIRNKSGTWMASLLSTNFWGQIASAILWIATFYGAVIPDNTAGELVTNFASQNWGQLLSILFVNVLLPVLHIFVKPKVIAAQG